MTDKPASLANRLRNRVVPTFGHNAKLAGSLYQTGTEIDPLCAEAADEIDRLKAIEAAARNLVRVKGRYHTEQAYNALALLFAVEQKDKK